MINIRSVTAERIGTGVLVLATVAYLAMCAFPELLAPLDPLKTNTSAILQPPSAEHILGTDQSGRDLYTRIIHGAFTTLGGGILATLLGAGAGTLLGTLSAFGPRWERAFALRLTEIGMSLPDFLLALLLLAFLGPGFWSVTIAVAVAVVPGYARIAAVGARAAIISDAAQTAKTLRISRLRRVFSYVLPAALRPILGIAVLGVATAVMAIAALTFLGLGLQAPDPDWGAMLSQGKTYVTKGWWVVVFPGIALIGAVFVLNIWGRKIQRRTLHD